MTFALTCVTFPEELHAHDGENEDNDTEDEGEVTESTNSFPHDGDEKVESGPGLGKFKYSQLQVHQSSFITILLLLLHSYLHYYFLCYSLLLISTVLRLFATHQPKRSKDGKTGDIVQAELKK